MALDKVTIATLGASIVAGVWLVYRLLVGPLHVSSGFRCEEPNRINGGVPNSQHRLGQAADILPIKTDLKAAYLKLVDSKIPFN